METVHTAVAILSASAHSKGCSCLKAWTQFQADARIQAELQQGVFNDVNEIGTSKIDRRLARLKKRRDPDGIESKAPPGWENTVKHMKHHSEITNPYALSNWMKDRGDTPHK